MIRKLVAKYPKKSYATVLHVIQSGFICLQRVTKTGIAVHMTGEDSSGNIPALLFLRKIKISPIHRWNLKYGAGQEIRPGPPKLGDVSR